MSARSETLTGTLERIVFANEENHFTIGRLKVAGQREPVAILGQLPGVQCGEQLTLNGRWEQSREHGKQFRFDGFESRLPSSIHGIRKFLGSGFIPNIGPNFAEKIVGAFGSDTLRIINEESARLREVPGIGAQRARAIKKAWDEQSALRDILIFLQQYGVGNAVCYKLIRRYGDGAVALLRNDPYRVATEVTGIGFKTADRIAINLGFASDSEPRLEAGVLFALSELEGAGHTGAESSVLIRQATRILDCPPSLAEQAIRRLLGKGLLIDSGLPTGFLQLPTTGGAEQRVADAIGRLIESPSDLPPIKVEKAVEWACERSGFEFAPGQRDAIVAALESKVAVITGGPGTGKTTILQALVAILKAKKVEPVLAAPTGRAAQRLAESTGFPAFTLHRLVLRAEGKYRRPTEDDLTQPPPDLGATRFLIVDEASMIDTTLASRFLPALNRSAHCVLVGDVDQLPSIGPGTVLADVIRALKSHS